MSTQENRGQWGNKESFNLLYLAANVMGACVTPFLRTKPGREYPGLAGLLALVVIFAWAGFGKCPELLTYLGVWLVAVMIMRVGALKNAQVQHSRYTGKPWLAQALCPFAKEATAKGFVEPVLCFIAAAIASELSPGLGGFFVACGIGLMATTLIDKEIVRRQVERAKDAEIEMKAFAQRMREQRPEW